jgi:hypothetical protein
LGNKINVSLERQKNSTGEELGIAVKKITLDKFAQWKKRMRL